MKMIRFENVCDSIREAMFRFYMEQTCFDRDVCVEKIEKLVDRTFDAMSEIPNTRAYLKRKSCTKSPQMV